MEKQITLPLTITGIKEEGYHIFIDIGVDGQQVRMLLDTGASRTVFDSTSLKAIVSELEMEENEDKATGLGSDTVENFIAHIKELSLGELVLKDYQVGVLDLQHVNMSYERIDLLPIAGVLGSDILVKYQAVIDLKERVVRLNNVKI